MKKRLLVATLAFAALAPLAAHASGGVVVSVNTPQFGFRIGSPFYGSPVYAPVYAPPVIAAPPVYGPPVVMVPPPRVYYPAPVVVAAPPVVYAPAYIPRPRVVYPRVAPPAYYRPPVQHAGYWVASGHAGRYTGNHYR